MQHICLYCTGANASNTAANQTDLSLWDSAAGAADGSAMSSGPVITTGPTHASSISHCNSAGCNGNKPSAPPVTSTEEDAEEDEDDDDFIDEDNPLLLDQVGSWGCVSSSFETDADLHPSRKTLAQFDNNY